MNASKEPLIKDEYTEEPVTKKVLAHLQIKRKEGEKDRRDLLRLRPG